ncbi:MAG TPA: hypothetical protein VEC19_18550 [Usitatibacter sp.]|nr:hypothetical protein [Usitatibacter sp.]
MMPERRRGVSQRGLGAALAFACLSMPVSALQTPPQMMANVFRFSEAGAVLEICFASEAFKALPGEKSAKLRQLAARLSGLVQRIGTHWSDPSLLPTYEATRDRIAAESRLKLHVKNHYDYCGEKLASSMEQYVVENEALIAPVFLSAPTRAVPRRPPEPQPIPSERK